MNTRIPWILIAAAMLLLAPALHAAEKQRMAVLEFAVRGKVEPTEVEVITEELRGALANSGKFELAGPELTAQVNKAWLSQPANLKDRQKAVNLGKRFDVRLIVTGKLFRFSSGWQVSAKLLDTKTGETKKSQTYRARGDFLTLLERKVPALGRVLSGMEPGGSAVAGRAKHSKLREGKGKKLAIFPEVLVGSSPKIANIESAKLAARISRQVAKQYGCVYVAYSFLELPKEEHAGMRGSIWRVGITFARPSAANVRNLGKALGVDMVMQVVIRTDEVGSYGVYETTHEVHLLGVNSASHIKTSGRSGGKHGWDLLNEIESSIGEAMEKYRSRERFGQPPCTPQPALAKLERPKPAGAKPAVVKQQTGAKLAIFPEILVGDSPQAANIESAKLAARISRQIAKHPGSVYVAYSYLDRAKGDHAGLRQTVWTIGNISARPNVGGMHSRGKALGVDVVMQVLIRIDDMENPRSGTYEATYEVHVLEVNSRHHFKISGKSSGKIGWELLNEVESSIGEAIEKYKSKALPR